MDILCEFKDYHRAAKWAKKLELQKVHPLVWSRMKQLPPGPVTFGDDSGSTSREQSPADAGGLTMDAVYLPFPLSSSSIVMVDTLDKYSAFLDELLQLLPADGPLRTGVDAEWPPQQTQLGSSKVSLLQIAVAAKVFLLDILTLLRLLSAEQWVEGLGQKFIANPRFCKLGFGLREDFRTLNQTVKALGDASILPQNIFDLKNVCDNLAKRVPQIFTDEKARAHPGCDLNEISSGKSSEKVDPCEHQHQSSCQLPSSPSSASSSPHEQSPVPIPSPKKALAQPKIHGLAALAKCLLGKPLDKRPQCSDWDRRPLRESQMTYAALDALVLILIYDELDKRIKDLGLEDRLRLEEIHESKVPLDAEEEQREKEEKKKKKREKQQEKSNEKRRMRGIKAAIRSEEFAAEMKK